MIASSLSPHVAETERGRDRERMLLSVSLPLRTLILLYKDPTLMTSITLLLVFLSNYSHVWGLGLQLMNWRGHSSVHSTGKINHCPQWKRPPEACAWPSLNTALGNFYFADSILFSLLFYSMDFPGGSVVKNPPANAGYWLLSLGWEDPLEKEIVTHFSTLAWKIPWMEEPGRLQSMVGALS